MKKAFSMSKVMGTIRKKPTNNDQSATASPPSDNPEAIVTHYVKQFCASDAQAAGDEITFLPPIVDAAESSPAAAAECTRLVRKYLHRDYWTRPSYQYNAIMLLRILSDNPGMTFTRNMDKKFVDTAKELLRTGRDPSVRQMLMETLDAFEKTKAHDEGLGPLIEMWRREKDKATRMYGPMPTPYDQRAQNGAPHDPHSQNYFARAHSNRRLPHPVELANRLEEARTSAKLLEQVVASTPPSEVLQSELIKEFADRCLSASRSIQGYMTAEDPAPDNETMESLIDTNEQLQQSLNQHQRAVLNARKQLGINDRSHNPSPVQSPPPVDERTRPTVTSGALQSSSSPRNPGPANNGKGKASSAEAWSVSDASQSQGRPSPDDEDEDERDPFRDPAPDPIASSSRRAGPSTNAPRDSDEPRLAYEPYHPGFGPSSGSSSRPPRETVTPVSDRVDEDAYDATPPKKQSPLYRY